LLTIAKSAVFYDGGIKASSVTGIPYFMLAQRRRTLSANAAKNHCNAFNKSPNADLCGKLRGRLVSISIERGAFIFLAVNYGHSFEITRAFSASWFRFSPVSYIM